jgi:predicted RNA binding protein YcfA (HicA-like mRNA interferase family)
VGTLLSSKCGFATLLDPHGGRPASAGLGALVMDSKSLIKLLEQQGWLLRGVKGSHHGYVHPDTGRHLSVPHPKPDLGKGLVHRLLKDAGLKP